MDELNEIGKMKIILNLILGAFLSGTVVFAGDSPAAKNEPFAILDLVDSNTMGWKFRGTNTSARYLRIHFQIKDSSIKSLDTAMIYLFDQDKKKVGVLKRISSQRIASFQTISKLTDLEPKTYNLVYTYNPAELKFKYAIAVLGTKEKVVTRTMPGKLDLSEFDFSEKKLIK